MTKYILKFEILYLYIIKIQNSFESPPSSPQPSSPHLRVPTIRVPTFPDDNRNSGRLVVEDIASSEIMMVDDIQKVFEILNELCRKQNLEIIV